jgi:hypothetical protein
MQFSLHLILEASLENSFVRLTPSMMHVAIFCDIRSAMVSKHSELTKWHARDRYERFASPLSRTFPPPSRMQEVGRSSCRRTAPPPTRQEEASSDDLVGDVGDASSSSTSAGDSSSSSDMPG